MDIAKLIPDQPFIGILLLSAALGLFGTAYRTGGNSAVGFWPWLRRIIGAVAAVGLFLGLILVFQSLLEWNYRNFDTLYIQGSQRTWQTVQRNWGNYLAQEELRVQHWGEVEVQEALPHRDPSQPPRYQTVTRRQYLDQNSVTGFTGTVGLDLIRLETQSRETPPYNTYRIHAEYVYEVSNLLESETEAHFFFPFGDTPLYETFKIFMDGQEITAQTAYSDGLATWKTKMLPGQRRMITITYVAQGMDAYYYQILTPREIRNFSMTLTTNTSAFYLISQPQSDALHCQITPLENQPGNKTTCQVDRALLALQMGIAFDQPEAVYAPYELTGRLLSKATAALGFLIGLLTLTLLLWGEPVRRSDLTLFLGGYAAQFFILAGLAPQLGRWPAWGIGAALCGGLMFFLIRRYSSLQLRILLAILVGLFIAYPQISLITDPGLYNGIATGAQSGCLIYLFGLTLYTQIRKAHNRIRGGLLC